VKRETEAVVETLTQRRPVSGCPAYFPSCSPILKALTNRPVNQHVVITGRAASDNLIEAADTVSEILDIKHAFRANIKAQKGLDL